jgi:hypothetical protein
METAIIDELEQPEGTIAAFQERIIRVARNPRRFPEGEQWRAAVGYLNGAMFNVSGAKTVVWYMLTAKGEGDEAAR